MAERAHVAQDRSATSRTRSARGWRDIGWGSDAALVVWAPTVEELLVEGARALVRFSLGEVEPGSVDPGPPVTVRSLDSTELFLDWLNEVNYHLVVHGWATWSPLLSSLTGDAVCARLDGFAVERSRHPFLHEVKAATRHRPLLRRNTAGTWVARVTLDL